MTSSTARTQLRSALSARLVPALRSVGFDGPASINGHALLHRYTRHTPDGTHVLEIQLEKHPRPRFAVNLHIEPAGGLDNLFSRGGTLVTARLQAKRGPFTTSWFRADRPWWQRAILQRSDTLKEEALEHCLSLLPEVEAAPVLMPVS